MGHRIEPPRMLYGSIGMPKITQPIKIHGGKHYLAPKIVALFPRSYITYCEPYFGGGSVMFAANPNGHSEIANDLDDNLMALWRVIADSNMFPAFASTVAKTPFSEPLFRNVMYDRWAHGPGSDLVKALNTFITIRQSMAGRKKEFAPISSSRTRRGMNEQVSAWLTAVDGLPEVHERMRRVLLLDRPAVQLIGQVDNKKTLFYLDPPYLHGTRTTTSEYGLFEMTYGDHVELLGKLSSISGKFLLSGYRSALYDEYAAQNKWKRHEFTVANSAASGKTKRLMVECLWSNY